jgi:hypothetical protein
VRANVQRYGISTYNPIGEAMTDILFYIVALLFGVGATLLIIGSRKGD